MKKALRGDTNTLCWL